MKLALCIVAVALLAGISQADKLQETIDNIKNEYGTKFSNMKTDLTDVGQGLKDLAKHKISSLGGQAVQAVIGAFANAFKGFDLAKILIGKRDIDDFVWKLILNATERIEDTLDRTFQKFEDAISSLRHLSLGPIEKFHSERLEAVAAEHTREVRGVIGDTLNQGIGYLKSLFYKAKAKLGELKDSVLGGSSNGEVVSDPVMIGKRGLTDAWNSLTEKFDQIKQTAYHHARGASEVVNHVSKVIGHYGGQMVEHAKNQALSKASETFGALKDHLTGYLSGAKDSLEAFKQQVTETMQNIVNGQE